MAHLQLSGDPICPTVELFLWSLWPPGYMLKTYSFCFYIQQLLKCQIFEVLILQAEISIFLNGHTAGVAVRSYLVCDKKRLSAPGTAEHWVQLCCSNVSWVRSNISIRERNLENLYFASIQDPDFQKKKKFKNCSIFPQWYSQQKQSHASSSNDSDKLNLDICLCKSGRNTDANKSIQALLIKANPCGSRPVSLTASSLLYKVPYQ